MTRKNTGKTAQESTKGLTIANQLTLMRAMLIVPLFVSLYLPGIYNAYFQLGVFLLAAVSDFLDGYLARRMNQITDFGRFLDPIADKLMVVTVLFVLILNGTIYSLDIIPAYIIIMREIYVSGLREFKALQNKTLHVTPLAKYKTATQMLALLALLGANALAAPQDVPIYLAPGSSELYRSGIAFLWFAALLSMITAAEYTLKNPASPQNGKQKKKAHAS